MRVLLAGATGTLGSALIPLLLAEGHHVLALTRSAAGAARLAALGVQPVQADLMNAEDLLAALDGRQADAVIHQATSITGVPFMHRHLYATDALRERGTAHLLRAAAELGARRFLTQSFFLGYGYRDHGDRLLDEDHPFAVRTGQRGFDRHMNSLRANEAQVLDAPGIDGIALRYGMFYGPEPATRRLIGLARRRRLLAPHPSGTVSLIHIHDAATATIAALHRCGPDRSYNIVDDHPVDFETYFRAVAQTAGAPPPRRVPGHILAALPYLHALMVTTHVRLSNRRAVDELMWTPRYPSYRDGLAALI